jgi:hypothetical protein
MRDRAVRLSVAAVLLVGCSTIDAARGASKEERRRRVEDAATVREYPPVPWRRAHQFKSKHYLITTNTPKEVSSYVGQLMDYVQKKYRSIFNYDGEVTPLPVYVYRTSEEFFRIGDGPQHPDSGGFYRAGGESAIHIRYDEKYLGTMMPTRVLLHEGTHQFVDLAFFFEIPQKYRDRFSDNVTRLPSIPLWLNEGLATFMEVSYYDGEDLVIGEVNRSRLIHLQRLLRAGAGIPFEELFAVESPKNFGLDHYATAWGITYWFLVDQHPAARKRKRKILRRYVEKCSTAFLENPGKEFGPRFLEGTGKSPFAFTDNWNRYIHEEGAEVLRAMTVGKGKPFDRWEAAWKEWILKLDPDEPDGGLK